MFPNSGNGGVLETQSLERAFFKVDRRDFVLPGDASAAYTDSPLLIGWGQTISQPYTVAFMLTLLDIHPGQSILDIGSGSGWTTALLAYLAGPEGSVEGLERIPQLVTMGRANLGQYPSLRASIIPAGPVLGLPGRCFHRILVSAAAQTFPHDLTGQLDDKGILVIPVRNSIWKIIRQGDRLVREEYFGFSFVPLVVCIFSRKYSFLSENTRT